MTDYLSKKIKAISFLAILCVIVQHAINFTGYIDQTSVYKGMLTFNTGFQYIVGYGFSRIAVAMFFMLSGYLFFRNYTLIKTFLKWKSRIRSLVVPYLLWGMLSILFIVVLQLPFTQGYFSSLYTGYLPGHPFSFYFNSILHHGIAFQLWFLSDLMIYTLIAPLFYIVLRYTSVFLIIPLYLLWIMQVPLPPMFSFLYRGGIFYLLGAYIALFQVYIPTQKQKPIALAAFVCWLFMIAVKTCVAFGVLPSAWISLPQLDAMAMLMGIAAVWFGYDHVASSRFVQWISFLTPFTFFVYASHEPLLEVVKRIGIDIFGRSDMSLTLLYVVTIGSVLLITVCTAFLVKRFLPKIYMVLTGGR